MDKNEKQEKNRSKFLTLKNYLLRKKSKSAMVRLFLVVGFTAIFKPRKVNAFQTLEKKKFSKRVKLITGLLLLKNVLGPLEHIGLPRKINQRKILEELTESVDTTEVNKMWGIEPKVLPKILEETKYEKMFHFFNNKLWVLVQYLKSIGINQLFLEKVFFLVILMLLNQLMLWFFKHYNLIQSKKRRRLLKWIMFVRLIVFIWFEKPPYLHL
jgi:hypothetical protein